MTRTGFEYLLRIESLRDISSSFVAEQARFDSKVRFDLLGKCLDSKGGQKSGQLNGKNCPQLCPGSARGTAFLIRHTPAGNYLSKPQADGKGFTSLARPRLFLMKLSIHEGCLQPNHTAFDAAWFALSPGILLLHTLESPWLPLHSLQRDTREEHKSQRPSGSGGF